MAYIIKIPNKYKERLKEVIKTGKEKENIEFLLEIYYKYCTVVDDWRKEYEFALFCGNCHQRTISYFKRNISRLE